MAKFNNTYIGQVKALNGCMVVCDWQEVLRLLVDLRAVRLLSLGNGRAARSLAVYDARLD